MVVTVEEIRDEGLELDLPIAISLLDEALRAEGKDTGFRALESSNLRATFHKVSGGVLLRGGFDATVVTPCKRCLVDVTSKIPVSFTLNLVPPTALAGDDAAAADDDEAADNAGSFLLADVDAEPFDGRRIELDPIIREQMLLALPMQVVCRDDCAGLCASCGQNLNESKCGCDQKVPDPRLAVLKDIKLN